MNPNNTGRRRLPLLPMAALMAASACTAPPPVDPCLLRQQHEDGSITCLIPRGAAPAPAAAPVPARTPVDQLRAVGAGGAA
ncbi:hypothetical protein [Niveispirillum cyanobacteriorum]|uniref:Uncharacterized protein n=1 Tax=Niveispirillum cyanobacteriorum TaxID=1612173 RepID=A0A2K9NFV4_9PROT|nr:hypothetical protein [Niveispirillum cyanobacteriorum]AUN31979.1 hypothetical protein C0V82_16245 [Niveispirillum cyanobacteriorum]GGE85222.1 hypothetical protein GCM10011317_48060 [Niveispirillum cyanobacteriorum]